MEKQFNLLIDTKRTGFNTVRGLKQGDNNSVLDITLVQNSIPFDLTDLTIRINYKRPDNKIFLQIVDVVNAAEGKIKVNILTKALETAGEVKSDLSVFDKDNRKITSATFSMFVDASIYGNDYIEPEDLDLIQQIYSEEEKRIRQENEREINEKTRQSNENIRIENENVRKDRELERIRNEELRQENEKTRESNELIRHKNEETRKTNETQRGNRENLREEQERVREYNEGQRQAQENVREQNEELRKQTQADMKNVIININEVKEYDNSKQYNKLNRVVYNGSCYECIEDTKGNVPTDRKYWICIAQKGKDGKDGDGAGDMLKENYDKNNNGVVDLAEKALSVEWVDVKNVPLNEIGKVKSVNGKDGEVVLNASDIKTSREKSIEQELTDTRTVLLNLTTNKLDEGIFNDFKEDTEQRLDAIYREDTKSIMLYVDGVNGLDSNSGLSKSHPLLTLEKAFANIPTVHPNVYIEIIGDIQIKNDITLYNKFGNGLNLKLYSNNGSSIKGTKKELYFDNIAWITISDLIMDNVIVSSRLSSYVDVTKVTFKKQSFAVCAYMGGHVNVSNCTFENVSSACIYACGGVIHSSDNVGTAKFGLIAREGGVISKQGTQPTGTTANEYTTNGGVIR